MSINYARTGDVRPEESADPRTRLAEDKFFSLRPKPLERWLWRQRVCATAERVFWFHWTEGARSGDWCSQVALHFVAQYCEIDVSTVTRAYQLLKGLGLLRRTDPGRDDANRFQQATAITEVLIPRELASSLNTFPNRPRLTASTIVPVPPTDSSPAPASPSPVVKAANPYADLDLKQQRARVKALAELMSLAERQRWHAAICSSIPRLEFDPDTDVPPPIQAEILQYLASREVPVKPQRPASAVSAAPPGPRRLGVFDLARMRRDLQQVVGIGDAPEVTRQVLWAIEEGPLMKFTSAHAINIALKKLRQKEWTRPNRMPPNWLRPLEAPQGSCPASPHNK